jgi:hypothetical protein
MFNEIYFWMYSYLSRIKTNKTPAYSAYLIVSVLQIFNLGTLCVWINYFLKFDIDKNSAVYLGLILAATFSIVNYFVFYAKREVIFRKLEELQSNRKIKGQIYFWLYVILSFVIFFVSVANLVTPKY